MIEAVLQPAAGSAARAWEVAFFYCGRFVLHRRWETREHALAHAGAQRDELLQRGWSLHW